MRYLEGGGSKPAKGWYRCAQAQIGLSEHGKALESLREVLKLEPKNAEARKLFDSCQKDSRTAAQAERRAAEAMFRAARKLCFQSLLWLLLYRNLVIYDCMAKFYTTST